MNRKSSAVSRDLHKSIWVSSSLELPRIALFQAPRTPLEVYCEGPFRKPSNVWRYRSKIDDTATDVINGGSEESQWVHWLTSKFSSIISPCSVFLPGLSLIFGCLITDRFWEKVTDFALGARACRCGHRYSHISRYWILERRSWFIHSNRISDVESRNRIMSKTSSCRWWRYC